MRFLRWLTAALFPRPSAAPPQPIPSIPQVPRTVAMDPPQFTLTLTLDEPRS